MENQDPNYLQNFIEIIPYGGLILHSPKIGCRSSDFSIGKAPQASKNYSPFLLLPSKKTADSS